MKQVLITFFILISISLNTTYAVWVCPIKDKTATVLSDYINNNNKVIKNVTDSIVSNKEVKENNNSQNWVFDGIKNDLNIAKNEITTMFNEMFSFSWYYSYFNYFAVFPISNDIPFQVKRDYRLLDKETKDLIKYLKKIDKKDLLDIIVKDPCDWVRAYTCEFDDNSVKTIILNLIKNNERILDMYRLIIMWEYWKIELEKEFNLTDDTFYDEMKENYNTETMSLCNSEKWWFMEQVTDAIDNIKSLNEQAEGWIDKWKEARELLVWNRPDLETKLEKELLLKYLKESWVSPDNQKIMLNNLEKYNAWWITEENNFLANTFKSIWDKIEDSLKKWQKELFWDNYMKDKWSTTINEIQVVTDNSKKSKEIKERIAELYEKEIPFASIEDSTTQNLRTKIIKTHISLDSSIKTLEKTIDISRKVCNNQASWKWDCN